MRLRSVKAIIEALNNAGVRYLVVGGVAVIAHGYLRYTKDIDFVVQLLPDNIMKALEALEKIGYRPLIPVKAQQFADRATRERWIREKDMKVFQLWSDEHLETPIDLFAAEPFDFDDEYRRAVHKSLFQQLDVPVVTITTLIGLKETSARPEDKIDVEHLRVIWESHEQS